MIDVKVAATDRAFVDPDNRIALFLDAGVGHGFKGDIPWPAIDECFHGLSPCPQFTFGALYSRIFSLPSWDMCTSSGPSAMRRKRFSVKNRAIGVSLLTPMPPCT